MNPTDIQKILGITFKNERLLIEALTHRSYAHQMNTSSNERLEFLGDAIISAVISEFLYLNYPDIDEAILSRTRAHLICRKSIVELARKINLNEYILLSENEERMGGRNKDSILSICFEALIGAIYLDQDYYFVKNFIIDLLKDKKIFDEIIDFKTQLQEFTQKFYKMLPVYEVVEEIGQPHRKIFKVVVKFKNKIVGTGTGRTKKEAEQNAAKEAIEKKSIVFQQGGLTG